MALHKVTEAGVTQRQHIISQLKVRREKAGKLERLKNNDGWEGLKAVLEQNLEALRRKKDFALDESAFEDYNHFEAKKYRALEKQILTIIDAVENPGEVIAELSGQIATLQEQIKEAQEAQ